MWSWMISHCSLRAIFVLLFVDLLCVSHLLIKVFSIFSANFTEKAVYCAEWVTCYGNPHLFPCSYELLLLHVMRFSCLIFDADMFSVFMLDTYQSHSVGDK